MNARTFVFLVLSAFSAAAFAAVPTVGNVRLSGHSKATVTYDLTGAPGIVTMEIQTNTVEDLSGEWVAIDGQLLRDVSGDVSCVVQPGTDRKIKWPARAALGGSLKNVRAVLTAWATNAPPDYLVVNLAGQDVPRYYTSTNYFPCGFGHLAYKTTNVVYKLVKAKGRTFTAGEYTNCLTPAEGGGNPHVINMTRDYYLSIYELTQAQYHWATGYERPWEDKSWPAGMNYDRPYPCTIMWYSNFRNGDWKTPLDKTTFCGAASAKSGLHVDLPTEAEWEFAARCGGYRKVRTQIVNGEPAEDLHAVANANGYSDDVIEVGLLTPNDWGFYDMIGNVWEICLDVVKYLPDNMSEPILEETTDPHGLDLSDGGGHSLRGGNFASTYTYNTVYRNVYGQGQHGYGGRTVVVIEEPVE